jgi:hypothetical protein
MLKVLIQLLVVLDLSMFAARVRKRDNPQFGDDECTPSKHASCHH